MTAPVPTLLQSSAPTRLEVLLVAPDMADGARCQGALQGAGFEVGLELAPTASEFSALVSRRSFHLVLAEQTLPGWNGLQALEFLRQIGKEIPFILLTSSLPDDLLIANLQCAGADFLGKEHLFYLPVTVRRALERKALRDDRLRLEAQLQHAHRMESVGRLAAGVAHDFNNILTVIQGHVGLLRSEPALREEMSESLQQVSRATERAGKLVSQLLSFTRDHAFEADRLDLNETLAHLSMLLQRTLGEDVAVQLSCAPDLPPIQADRGLIEQVVLDLAVHARDAMPAGGQLVISTSAIDLEPSYLAGHPEACPGRFVCMSIIDTGGGPSSERLGCLLGAPFSPPASLPEDDLLLATVRAIVKRHYGWIESQSQPGQGSTFRIFLPASMAEEPNNQHTGKKIRGGTETVLVVEDEPPVLWITRNILQHHGYHVLEATSGVEALAIWHQHQEEIALLLTDIVMPVGVSGQELAQQFQQQKPSLKVIYTSGYSAAAAANDLKLVSGMNFLKKPYDAERLSATVRSCLDREAA